VRVHAPGGAGRRWPLLSLLGLAKAVTVTERLLTARTVGELLEVHPETVLRWTRRGQLPAIRLPSGQIRFREDEIAEWLEERATPSRGVVEHPAGRRPRPSVHSLVSSTPEGEED
jgi:excisionase family DNA binding protein